MKTTIIGGNWGTSDNKESKIVKELSNFFDEAEVFNGGKYDNLPTTIGGDLAIWMPNIIEETISKKYPVKDRGTTLIISKVVRETEGIHPYTIALNRLFKMQANAVICIEKPYDLYIFTLIDALSNIWIKTSDIDKVAAIIKIFYKWNSQQIRTSINLAKNSNKFMDIVKNLAIKITNSSGSRYFGNCSTRCMSLFPSIKTNNGFFVSPRNIDKQHITVNDMIYIDEEGCYHGEKKPSVDTPITLKLYNKYSNINYIIHGHAFFENDVLTTNNYFACGDLQEMQEIFELIKDCKTEFFVINLKKHGFLIGAKDLIQLENFLNNNIPEMKLFRVI